MQIHYTKKKLQRIEVCHLQAAMPKIQIQNANTLYKNNLQWIKLCHLQVVMAKIQIPDANTLYKNYLQWLD